MGTKKQQNPGQGSTAKQAAVCVGTLGPKELASPGADPVAPYSGAVSSSASHRSGSRGTDSLLHLHRSTMVDWKLAPVVALTAWQADGSTVAVGYEDGAIELWDTDTWACFLEVPAQEGPELSCLAWVPDPDTSQPRLFAAFLDGTICEVDLVNLRLHAESHSYGGAVWCLTACPEPPQQHQGDDHHPGSLDDARPPEKRQRREEREKDVGVGGSRQLAAACDDGCVRVLTVESGTVGVSYSRTLARVEGRLLALAWHPDGHTLVSGGVDGCIRCWDVARGLERCRITASVKTRQALCVWALAVLSDGTIIAGDSEGGTAFYEPQFGTQIARFAQHQGDVLAVRGTPDGLRAFSSGVDARVALFERVHDSQRGTDEWVYRHFKAPHTHDVRALEIVDIPDIGPMLLSGGNDAQLLLYPANKFLQQHPVRVCRAPRRPRIHIAPNCSASHNVNTGWHMSISGSKLAQSASYHQQNGTGGDAGSGRVNGEDHVADDVQASVDLGGVGGNGLKSECWMLACQGRKLDVWQLGRPGSVTARPARRKGALREGDFVDVVDPPLHLAQLTTSGRSGMVCSAISRCGKYVACSDNVRPRLYRLARAAVPTHTPLTPAEPQLQVERCHLANGITPAACLTFTPDSSALLTASTNGRVAVVDLQTGEEVESMDVPNKCTKSEALQSVSHANSASTLLQPHVSHMAVSPLGGLIATAGACGVHLFHLRKPSSIAPDSQPPQPQLSPTNTDKTSKAGAAQLPGNSAEAGWQLVHVSQALQLGSHAPVVALQFSPCGSLLLVARADAALQLFDAHTGAPSKWSLEQQAGAAQQLEKLPGALLGLSFRPLPATQELLLHTSSGFCYLDLQAPPPVHGDSKKSSRKRPLKPFQQLAANSHRGSNWRLFHLEHPCLYLGYIQPNAALLLECPWEDVVAQLPAPLFKHQYGS